MAPTFINRSLQASGVHSQHPVCPDRAWFSWGWESTAKGGGEAPPAWKESTLLSGPLSEGPALGTGSHTRSLLAGKEPPLLLISPKRLGGVSAKGARESKQGEQKGTRGAQKAILSETVRTQSTWRGLLCSRNRAHPATFLSQKMFLTGAKNSPHSPNQSQRQSHLCLQTLALAGAERGAIEAAGPGRHRGQGGPGLGDPGRMALGG